MNSSKEIRRHTVSHSPLSCTLPPPQDKNKKQGSGPLLNTALKSTVSTVSTSSWAPGTCHSRVCRALTYAQAIDTHFKASPDGQN